jgi:hypothetical protein
VAGSHDHDDSGKDARERDQAGAEDGGHRVCHARTRGRSKCGLVEINARRGEAWHRQNTADTDAADQYSRYERDRDDHYHR